MKKKKAAEIVLNQITDNHQLLFNHQSKMVSGSVNIDFYFEAPITTVWEAWTNPNLVVKWFGSEAEGVGLFADVCEEPGKNFKVSFRDPNGIVHTCFGTYQTVIAPYELAFTWNWESEPGIQSIVSLILKEVDAGTQMNFEHRDVGTESAHNYGVGWKGTFMKLRRLIER